MKRIAIYLRVSTIGQDVASQEPDLRVWLSAHGRKRPAAWYRDTFTGKTFKRPAMQLLGEDIRSGKIGTVVVWRLDRLGRTASETLRFLDDLDASNVGFVSVRDGIDSTSAAGRLLTEGLGVSVVTGFDLFNLHLRMSRHRMNIHRQTNHPRS